MQNSLSSPGEKHCGQWCTIKNKYSPYQYKSNGTVCWCQLTHYFLKYNYHPVWGDTTVVYLVVVFGHDVGINLDKVKFSHQEGGNTGQHVLHWW